MLAKIFLWLYWRVISGQERGQHTDPTFSSQCLLIDDFQWDLRFEVSVLANSWLAKLWLINMSYRHHFEIWGFANLIHSRDASFARCFPMWHSLEWLRTLMPFPRKRPLPNAVWQNWIGETECWMIFGVLGNPSSQIPTLDRRLNQVRTQAIDYSGEALGSNLLPPFVWAKLGTIYDSICWRIGWHSGKVLHPLVINWIELQRQSVGWFWGFGRSILTNAHFGQIVGTQTDGRVKISILGNQIGKYLSLTVLLNWVTLRESSSSTTGCKNLLFLSGSIRSETQMAIQYIWSSSVHQVYQVE